MNPTVFLSYRRDDAKDVIGRVYDKLAKALGEENVFFDIDSIPLGVDFRRVLGEEVARCHVFIAVIGPNWLTAADKEGRRRLENPDDFVRIEIETALERGTPVVVALVQGAKVPSADQVPSTLTKLSECPAIQFGPDKSFHAQADQLLAAVRTAPLPPPRDLTAADRAAQALRRGRDWSVVGGAIGVFLFIIIELSGLAHHSLNLVPVMSAVWYLVTDMVAFGVGPLAAAFFGWRRAKLRGAAIAFLLAVFLQVGCFSLAAVAMLVFGDKSQLRVSLLDSPLDLQWLVAVMGESAIAGLWLGILTALTRLAFRWPRTWLNRQRRLWVHILLGAASGVILGSIAGVGLYIICLVSPIKDRAGLLASFLVTSFVIIFGIAGLLERGSRFGRPGGR